MSGDPVHVVVQLARSMGLTPRHLELAALQLADEQPTLREVLDRIGRPALDEIRRSYPQGLRRALLGEGAVPGFAEQSLARFTALEARSRARALRAQAAVRVVEDAARRGAPAAGGDRKAGYSAEESYIRALRAVGRLLVSAGYLAVNPMLEVPLPRRPGPSRSPDLTDGELRDYLRSVLLAGADPALDAACWLVLRLAAARMSEVLALRPVDVSPGRPSLVLDGKGNRLREMPVARPVLDLLEHLDRARPEDPSGALLRTRRGAPVSVRRFELWSRALHAEHAWAQGHAIRDHALRHTTARALERATGADSMDVTLFLGHAPQRRHGVTGVYIAPDASTAWERRCAGALTLFGPLDRWPDLPENDVLAMVPELQEWMS